MEQAARLHSLNSLSHHAKEVKLFTWPASSPMPTAGEGTASPVCRGSEKQVSSALFNGADTKGQRKEVISGQSGGCLVCVLSPTPTRALILLWFQSALTAGRPGGFLSPEGCRAAIPDSLSKADA